MKNLVLMIAVVETVILGGYAVGRLASGSAAIGLIVACAASFTVIRASVAAHARRLAQVWTGAVGPRDWMDPAPDMREAADALTAAVAAER